MEDVKYPRSPTGKYTHSMQRILSYLRENANVEIPYKDIQRDLGLPAYTISNGIGYLVAKGVPVTRPMRGVCIFRPNSNNRQTTQPPAADKPKASRDVYEYVGSSQGHLIVRGENDDLYILKPLFTSDL